MILRRKPTPYLSHSSMAMMIMKQQQFPCSIRASIRFIFTGVESHSFSPFHLFSTVAHSQNLFAHFAVTKFNLSSTDISRILKYAPKLQRLQTLEKVEQFVEILNKYGCNQHQIVKVMTGRPELLTYSAETVLEPKILLLKDSGIQDEKLPKVLTKWPSILAVSVERILRNLTMFKNIFQSQDLLIKAIVSTPSILTYDLDRHAKSLFTFWEEHGVVGRELAKFLSGNPSLLRCSSLSSAKLHLIQMIGIQKESKMYKHVLKMVAQSSIELLEAKIHNLQLCGLSDEETWKLVGTFPSVCSYSIQKIRAQMHFVVNDMELPANSVLKKPYLLQWNLENVVKPRFLVLQKLKSLNEVWHLKFKSFRTIFRMPEEKFVREVVKAHPESAKLCAIYENAIANASVTKRTSRKLFF